MFLQSIYVKISSQIEQSVHNLLEEKKKGGGLKNTNVQVESKLKDCL
jgi:hypothetical protein